MKITEVTIKLITKAEDKLLAFACVTFNRCFVVRDIKVIQGARGIFVAMPSRKITGRCPKCGEKNHLQANYCSQCGLRLPSHRIKLDPRKRAKLYADIAHPINTEYRTQLQKAILEAYHREVKRSREPGYRPPSFAEMSSPDYDDPLPYEPPPQPVGSEESTASSMQPERTEPLPPPAPAPAPDDDDEEKDGQNAFGIFA